MYLFESLNEEYKAHAILEAGGVAASPYSDVIDEIIKYCNEQCKTLKDNNTVTFNIPAEILIDVDIVSNFIIQVSITDVNNRQCGGQGHIILDADEFNNDKFTNCTIVLKGCSYKGRLLADTIYSSIYHEFNHLYDIWLDKMENGKLKRTWDDAIVSNIECDAFVVEYDKFGRLVNTPENIKSHTLNTAIETIIYRLFSFSERHAIAASVIGDLKSFNSKISNHFNDIRLTKAYNIYSQLKLYIDMIEKIKSEDKQILSKFLIKNKPFLIRTAESSHSIFSQFINKAKKYNYDLMKKIYYVARHYYANNEN